MRIPLFIPLARLASACGARVASSSVDAAHTEDSGGGGGGKDAGEAHEASLRDAAAPGRDASPTHPVQPHDAGPDCGLPSAPVYDCSAGTDGGSCGPWGSDASSPTYPTGCSVMTTECDQSFGGGALVCECQTFPGSPTPGWLCAL